MRQHVERTPNARWWSVTLPQAAAVDLDELAANWLARWPEALALWSRVTRVRDPKLSTTESEAVAEGLTGSIAMIPIVDQS